MPKQILVFLTLLFLGASPGLAEDNRETDRRALLKVMHDIEQGINAPDIELMARQFEEKAVITWLNAEISQGPDGVRDYFKRMVGNAPGTVLSKYVTHPKISGPAVFYGDVAVASGTTLDEFTPHERSVFKFDSRWTATLRKSDGQWKIVALHLSTNTFNNVLLTELRQLAYTFAVGGVVAGLLAAGAWRLWRRRQHA